MMLSKRFAAVSTPKPITPSRSNVSSAESDITRSPDQGTPFWCATCAMAAVSMSRHSPSGNSRSSASRTCREVTIWSPVRTSPACASSALYRAARNSVSVTAGWAAITDMPNPGITPRCLTSGRASMSCCTAPEATTTCPGRTLFWRPPASPMEIRHRGLKTSHAYCAAIAAATLPTPPTMTASPSPSQIERRGPTLSARGIRRTRAWASWSSAAMTATGRWSGTTPCYRRPDRGSGSVQVAEVEEERDQADRSDDCEHRRNGRGRDRRRRIRRADQDEPPGLALPEQHGGDRHECDPERKVLHVDRVGDKPRPLEERGRLGAEESRDHRIEPGARVQHGHQAHVRRQGARGKRGRVAACERGDVDRA